MYTFLQIQKRGNVTFLLPNKKVTKEIGLRRRYANAPSLRIHPPHLHPTTENVPIFGSLHRENRKFLSCKRSKIGTFLNAGWRCGWGFQRGRIFVAPLWLTSFGPFLVQRQEKDIAAPLCLRKGIPFCKQKTGVVSHSGLNVLDYFRPAISIRVGILDSQPSDMMWTPWQ